MWIIKNRNQAFGWYDDEGWTLDEHKAKQYPSKGLADVVIAQYGMAADAIEIPPTQPPPE